MRTMLAVACVILGVGAYLLMGCRLPDPPKQGFGATNDPMPYPPSLTNDPPAAVAMGLYR